MNYMYVCPRCEGVFSKEGSQDGAICPSCKVRLVPLGHGKESWYSLSPADRSNIKTETLEDARLPMTIARDQRNQQAQRALEFAPNVTVTTVDLHDDYEILGPVFFQINDAGDRSVFNSYLSKYQKYLTQLRNDNQLSGDRRSWLESDAVFYLLSGRDDRDRLGNNHALFDAAFFIAVEELKIRASMLGGDAIVGMRQELNLDTNGFQHFYLQLCGTAVKRKTTRNQ